MTAVNLRFPHQHLGPVERGLRQDVRAFLATRPEIDGIGGPERWNREFSRALAAQGWVGMTWPARYGGRDRSSLERHIVAEELFAAGAPVRAHWVADRQSGPLLLAFGSEAQKQRFLPQMARGELSFCIGMSEPGSGSDLASVRTRAQAVAGGWQITGTKLWTSNAHRADMMILFARTTAGSADADRHTGVSQFMLDMTAPGITVRPILNLAGEHDFNEVHLEAVFVPDAMVIGNIGDGWKQVTRELAHERSSPDRYLTGFNLLCRFCDRLAAGASDTQLTALGELAARLWAVQDMSRSVAGMLQQGERPDAQAALVKDLGATLEQAIPEIIRQILPLAERLGAPDDPLPAMLERSTHWAPAYSLRGGTREVLRGIIARGLGLR